MSFEKRPALIKVRDERVLEHKGKWIPAQMGKYFPTGNKFFQHKQTSMVLVAIQQINNKRVPLGAMQRFDGMQNLLFVDDVFDLLEPDNIALFENLHGANGASD